MSYSYPPYLKSLKMSVISDYLYVVAALVLEMMLFYLSIALIFATTEWITVLVSNYYRYIISNVTFQYPPQYVPLLIYSLLTSYPSNIAYAKKVLNDKEMQNFLLRHWQNYVEKNDLYWFQIQHDVSELYRLPITIVSCTVCSCTAVAWRDPARIWTICARWIPLATWTTSREAPWLRWAARHSLNITFGPLEHSVLHSTGLCW